MNQSLEEIITRSDALYDLREQPESVRASLELLEKDECTGNYEAAWRLSRAFFFLGQESATNEAARVFHSRGVATGKLAVNLNASRVEGWFWQGVNLGLIARFEGRFKALRRALRARRCLNCAVRLDASYHGAGPLRVLARLQHKLPALIGGGTKRARANFSRAIRIAPENTVTRLYFAELLLEIRDETGARRELESLLNTPHDPIWAFESSRDRKLAREMLSNAKLKM